MLISVVACTSAASTGESGALSTMSCQLTRSSLPGCGERGRVRGRVRGGVGEVPVPSPRTAGRPVGERSGRRGEM